jgi:hypothetical protein
MVSRASGLSSPLHLTWETMDPVSQEDVVRRTTNCVLSSRGVRYPVDYPEYESRNIDLLTQAVDHTVERAMSSSESTEHSFEMVKTMYFPTMVKAWKIQYFDPDQCTLLGLRKFWSFLQKRNEKIPKRWKSGALHSFWVFSGKDGMSMLMEYVEEMILVMESVVVMNEDMMEYLRTYDMEEYADWLSESQVVTDVMDGLIDFINAV